MKVEISANAERDLEAIADHIALDSPARAIAFLHALKSKCLSLSEHPNAFPLVSRYEALGVRRRLHGNYLIFYRVEDERIVILHILNGAMDYIPLLLSDGDSLD